jgi:phage host-nuclease inhibitor protein Gam
MPHPFEATIQLAKNVIGRLPSSFSPTRRQEMEGEIEALEKDEATSLAAIEEKMVSFGMEIWPYLNAYRDFYKIYGEAKEASAIIAALPAPAKKALSAFIAAGGDIETIRYGDNLKNFSDPVIGEAIAQAEAKAHGDVHKQMEELIVGGKSADFAALLAKYMEQHAALCAKIDDLEKLAARSEKWSAEIIDKVKVFKEGFCYLERTPSLDDIAREIQYYIDIMEV